MAGMSSGPTPWWQLPGQGAALSNLQSSAPNGYEYDPVQMSYVRTPSSAGASVNAYTSAALGGGSAGTPSSIAAITGGDGSGISGAASAGAGTGAGGPVSPGAQIAGPQMPDLDKANSLAFGAAKDKVGALNKSALASLNGELGATGRLGSGAQYQADKDIITSGSAQLGEEASNEATNAANLNAQGALAGYTGAITQRGQDIQSQQANASLAIQKSNQQMQMLDLILKSLGPSSPAAGLVTSGFGV